MSKVVFYSIIAVIGAMPLFFLVAAAMRISVKRAKKISLQFLEDWAQVAPEAIQGAVSSILGFATGFALLVALTFGFDKVGDEIMPHISGVFGYGGSQIVAWSVNSRSDWQRMRDDYRERWEAQNQGRTWEEHKNELEKRQVRGARTLFFFALLLIIAGGLDIFSARLRKRGLALLLIGVVATSACLIWWVGRKEHYIGEVVRLSVRLNPPLCPLATYPGNNPCLPR